MTIMEAITKNGYERILPESPAPAENALIESLAAVFAECTSDDLLRLLGVEAATELCLAVADAIVEPEPFKDCYI